jgi:hypothetical protein
MKKKTKIELGILIILIIIFIISLWIKQANNPDSTKIDCSEMCFEINDFETNDSVWISPVNNSTFDTKEECISACENLNR